MSEEIMSQEAFNEIIDNLEHIGTLTDYGKKGIKYNIKKLQKELQQEKEKNKKLKQEYEELDENFTLVIIGKERIEKENGELRKELEQEKEKNEKLVDKTIQYDKTLEKLQKDTIWKYKIKAKIDYYKKIDNAVGVKILERILEEN